MQAGRLRYIPAREFVESLIQRRRRFRETRIGITVPLAIRRKTSLMSILPGVASLIAQSFLRSSCFDSRPRLSNRKYSSRQAQASVAA